HTWSMVPPDLCVRVHGTLEKLCHEATDLCGAGYTLERLTLEAVEKLQKCYVCKGTRKTPNCSMHTGSRQEMLNESTKEMERHWTCCGLIEVPNRRSKRKSGGCYPLKGHDLEDLEALAANFEFLETPAPVAGSSKRKAVVLDCEMGGSHFNRNELIWVSVVDFFTGETLIHEFVKPSTEILDWRTQFSGVSGSMASSLEAEKKLLDGWQQARQQLLGLIDSETIIIGHALHNDLYQLRLIHRRVVDTALTIPRITGKKHSVQSLSLELLEKVVQSSAHGHDCLEDTLSARELLIWCLRHPDEVWERAVQSQRQ
ncbi:ribonuclease H-like domain-containing protein, partial [Pyronema omphalodes]